LLRLPWRWFSGARAALGQAVKKMLHDMLLAELPSAAETLC
jgi:hypothetical protein